MKKVFLFALCCLLAIGLLVGCKQAADSDNTASTPAKYNHDANVHWHTGDTDYAPHTWDDGTTLSPATDTAPGIVLYTCTVCGAVKTETILPQPAEHAHTFATAWSKDETYHWHAATCGHDEVADKAPHQWQLTYSLPATETSTGVNVYTCTECAATKTETLSIINHQHNYSEWVVLQQADCLTMGIRQKSCSCGDVITETIERTGHTLVVDEAVAPTCTQQGKTAGAHCGVCGTVLQAQEPIPMLAHQIVPHQGQPATCTQEGWQDYEECERCDYTTYQVLPPLQHDYTVRTTPPTCTERGYTTHTCTRCQDQYVDDYTAALDHDLTQHQGQPATCTQDGWVPYETCSRCNYTTYKSLPALDHDYNGIVTPPTCTKQGYTTYTCTRCQDVQIADYTPAQHAWGEWVVITALTCTQNGSQYHICTVCGERQQQTLYAQGHQGEWVVTEEADCAHAGERALLCTVCHETITQSLPQLSHEYGDWAVTVAPSCRLGQRQRSCSNCGAIQSEAIAPVMAHTYNNDNICTLCGEHKPSDGLQYRVSNGSATVSGYSGSDASVYIPTTYQGYLVVGISNNAFREQTQLTSVTIGSGVTSIGEGAFAGCSNLAEIRYTGDVASWCAISGLGNLMGVSSTKSLYIDGTVIAGDLVIPSSLTSIADWAFSFCSGLTSVAIPASVTSIGDRAFYGCSGLTSVTIGSGVTSIGSSAFCGCTGLTSVTIPSSVTCIGSFAFSGCSGLTSVAIGNGVKDIGDNAFAGCSGLTSITIPDSVTSIRDYAFWQCTGLTSVTIPDSVTSIGSYAFLQCTGLTSVSIPNSVTSIGSSAFAGCSGLTSVTIPDSVTSIGDYAFYNCSGLTSVTIPDSVTSIGNYAFHVCSGLTSITIPDGVTSIGEGAFECCFGLTSITIPDGVTSIGEGAFHGCTGLTSVTIPDSVTSIGSYAFYGCTELTEIHYSGTMEQWNSISKGSDWNYNTGTYTIYCNNGNISK